MSYWIPVYVYSAKGMKKAAEHLNAVQLSEMDSMFRCACQGMDSPDIRRIHEQHHKKTLFYHLSADTGLRYRIEINRRKGTVSILSVEADHGRLLCTDSGRRKKAAA